MGSRLIIRQRRSAIGEREQARGTLAALGLRRTGQVVERPDTPSVRGMVRRVRHLVDVEERDASA